MSHWDGYPVNYRQQEIETLVKAAQAGECSALVGLSGSGKSNLLGFMAARLVAPPAFVLVDANRIASTSPEALLDLVADTLGAEPASTLTPFRRAELAVAQTLNCTPALCLLFDRFDALPPSNELAGQLRALRDAHKYNLTYIIATRRPPDPHSELAELFYAHTLWLGPLSQSDALWSAARYAERVSLDWTPATLQALVSSSWGYPSFLRAACEAHAAGCPLEPGALAQHPAVRRRAAEFMSDAPDAEALAFSRLAGHPFLAAAGPAPIQQPAVQLVEPANLTAKEHLLWLYFQRHPGQVCEKDDLIRSVWSEDLIFERGVRDDSLAQLVRRLREKVEKDPSHPELIHTLPGRGYRYTP